MKTGPAFLAGVVGGAVMSALMWMARTLLGMDVKLEFLFGTLVGLEGTAAWIAGLVMHLVISGLLAIAYAWAFERLLHRAGAGAGALVAVVHILVAGVFMGLVLPMMHPLVPETMEGPGYFMLNLGVMGLVAFVMLHLIYGAIVGAMYGPVLHPVAGAPRRSTA